MITIMVALRSLSHWSLLAVISLCCSSALADGSIPESLREPFERSQLFTTWRNLSNESVMFPLDMGNLPVKLTPHRQLFLDNYLVAEAENVSREVHHPKRHPDNPIFRSRHPGVENTYVLNVLQFDTAPRFRMWYLSFRGWHKLATGQELRFGTSYAESDDGIHWRRPQLDLHKIEGLPTRNVVIPYGIMDGIFYEPDEPEPERRFKALVSVEIRNPTIRQGYYLHTSPDGIHWKADLKRLIILNLSRYSHPQNGIGDTSRFWWDPIRRKYVCDAKLVIPPKHRCQAMMTSDDLVHWTRAVPILLCRNYVAGARGGGDQIYGHKGFAYQGMYIGTRWVYRPEYDWDTHAMHVELDCSRDGRIWTRVGPGKHFMAVNPKRDTWDGSRMKPTTLLEVGDEIWIYYAAAPTAKDLENPDMPPSQRRRQYETGLATLKRDRFVSINGGQTPGRLVTRPLTFSGKRLYLNAEVGEGGSIRVALLAGDRKPHEGYRKEDAIQIKGGGLSVPVAWKDKKQLPPTSEGPQRLAFELTNAKLYAFWIE